jgi:hypothetical protein
MPKAIGKDANERQAEIDDHQLSRDVGGTGQRLAECVKAFGFEILHPAHPQHWQEDHGDEGDPKPTKRVQHAAPQVHARRQVFKTNDHGRSGGGDAGYRFKISVGEGQVGRAKHEWQRAE